MQASNERFAEEIERSRAASEAHAALLRDELSKTSEQLNDEKVRLKETRALADGLHGKLVHEQKLRVDLEEKLSQSQEEAKHAAELATKCVRLDQTVQELSERCATVTDAYHKLDGELKRKEESRAATTAFAEAELTRMQVEVEHMKRDLLKEREAAAELRGLRQSMDLIQAEAIQERERNQELQVWLRRQTTPKCIHVVGSRSPGCIPVPSRG